MQSCWLESVHQLGQCVRVKSVGGGASLKPPPTTIVQVPEKLFSERYYTPACFSKAAQPPTAKDFSTINGKHCFAERRANMLRQPSLDT